MHSRPYSKHFHTSNTLSTHLHQYTYRQPRGDQQIQQHSLFQSNNVYSLTGTTLMRPCQSLSLSLRPLRYNTSKAIRIVTKALLRPSPYQQDSIYWQMQEPTSIYRMPHFPPSTLCTLHTSGISPQWASHHIRSTLICL